MIRDLSIIAALGAGLSIPGQPLHMRNSGNDLTRLDNMQHIDTPRPLSKRAKRRLRGKAKGRKS